MNLQSCRKNPHADFWLLFSCTSTEQAKICNDACLEDFTKCIDIECNNDFSNAGCIRDCGDAADECDLKCPCQIGGECELSCPCPSFQCAPSCDEAEDIERSQVYKNHNV